MLDRDSLPVDSSWTADYGPGAADDQGAQQSPADYPRTPVRRPHAAVAERRPVPAWGTPNREAQVTDLLNESFFDPQLVRWRDVYGTAKKITQGATTP